MNLCTASPDMVHYGRKQQKNTSSLKGRQREMASSKTCISSNRAPWGCIFYKIFLPFCIQNIGLSIYRLAMHLYKIPWGSTVWIAKRGTPWGSIFLTVVLPWGSIGGRGGSNLLGGGSIRINTVFCSNFRSPCSTRPAKNDLRK